MIKLTNSFYMDADDNQYIVGTPYRCKDGATVLRGAKYYGTLDAALRLTAERVTRNAIDSREIESLNEVCGKLKKARQEIEAAFYGEKPHESV